MNLDFELKKSWSSVYDNKEKNNFSNKLENTVFFKLGDSSFYAYFNNEYIANKRSPHNKMNDLSLIQPIIVPFDYNKFNFSWIKQEEVLFLYFSDSKRILKLSDLKDQSNLSNLSNENNLHHVIINKSPIFKYHTLLVPNLLLNLPQRINSDCLKLIHDFFENVDATDLRIGFNSLGGYASVNHLHFQLIFLKGIAKEMESFPIENFERKQLLAINKNILAELIDYPVKVYVLAFKEINSDIFKIFGCIIDIFTKRNIAHNILFSQKGKEIYIIPRKNEKLNNFHGDLNCAWLEICGIAICRTEKMKETIDEKLFENVLKEAVSLEEQEYQLLSEEILQIA